jgi:hypothetical protein
MVTTAEEGTGASVEDSSGGNSVVQLLVTSQVAEAVAGSGAEAGVVAADAVFKGDCSGGLRWCWRSDPSGGSWVVGRVLNVVDDGLGEVNETTEGKD